MSLSKNFVLSFPVLRDEFLESPSNRSVSIGDKAKFTCRPPRGEPTPKVLWMKGRKFLTDSGRIQISENGDLIISQVSLKDADDYKCIATNTAGERESAPARLTVLGTFFHFSQIIKDQINHLVNKLTLNWKIEVNFGNIDIQVVRNIVWNRILHVVFD